MDLKAMDLSQVIHCLTWESKHTTDTIFLSQQWQCDLVEDLSLSPLSWSIHALLSLRFFSAALLLEVRPIGMLHPR